MSYRPKIGITGHVDKDSTSITTNYMDAIFACGGFPLLLPLIDDASLWQEAAQELDGFLFSGGVDVNPRLYGEEILHFCADILPARDEMELGLLKAVLPTRKPILGICRGIQLLNVGMGGTLYQDIYEQPAQTFPQQHNQKLPHHLPTHDVTISADSLLFQIVKTEKLPVNSLHHQSVKDCAPSLVVTAKTSSGMIEAVEQKEHPFFLGVQWHPERMWHADHSAKALFDAFVCACRGR